MNEEMNRHIMSSVIETNNSILSALGNIIDNIDNYPCIILDKVNNISEKLDNIERVDRLTYEVSISNSSKCVLRYIMLVSFIGGFIGSMVGDLIFRLIYH